MFVKICGVTDAEDALLAAGLGADAIGVNFVASSVRRVSPSTARDVIRKLPPEVLTVGIFRNHPRERVVKTFNEVGLRAVQLHGDETIDDVRWIAERVPNVIRALPAAALGSIDLAELASVPLLIDSPEPGSGAPFDWTQLAADPPNRPFILAGGLTPENLAEAIGLLEPWGVDVASGVESAPGRKDPVAMRRFIATARSMAPSGIDDDRSRGPRSGSPFDWEIETTGR